MSGGTNEIFLQGSQFLPPSTNAHIRETKYIWVYKREIQHGDVEGEEKESLATEKREGRMRKRKVKKEKKREGVGTSVHINPFMWVAFS